MRMWMCDPKIMCQKHLCGMHVEMHMFVGTMKRKKKIDGFLKNNCLEPLMLKKLHDNVANEMKCRGYNHNSPLTEEDFQESLLYLDECRLNHKINCDDSLNELIKRCEICNEKSKTM